MSERVCREKLRQRYVAIEINQFTRLNQPKTDFFVAHSYRASCFLYQFSILENVLSDNGSSKPLFFNGQTMLKYRNRVSLRYSYVIVLLLLDGFFLTVSDLFLQRFW